MKWKCDDVEIDRSLVKECVESIDGHVSIQTMLMYEYTNYFHDALLRNFVIEYLGNYKFRLNVTMSVEYRDERVYDLVLKGADDIILHQQISGNPFDHMLVYLYMKYDEGCFHIYTKTDEGFVLHCTAKNVIIRRRTSNVVSTD